MLLSMDFFVDFLFFIMYIKCNMITATISASALIRAVFYIQYYDIVYL